MSFWNKISPETKKTAEEFIDDIQNNNIKKRSLPNYSDDYPDEKALDSFSHLSKSDTTDKIMKKAYDGNNQQGS